MEQRAGGSRRTTFDLTPEWRALLFALGVTGFTGLAFGLFPALNVTRTDLTPALKEGGTSSSTGTAA